MRNLLLVVILCGCPCLLFAQNVIVTGSRTAPISASVNKDKSKSDPEESFEASIKCYYTFSQTNKVTRTDTMALLIGNTQSKFYNPSVFTRDSLFGSIINNINPNTIQSISVIKESTANFSERPGTTSFNPNDGESYQILKSRNKNSLLYIDYLTGSLGNSYGYNDVLELPWQISQDTTSILGFPCQKATIDFRGRSYVAWFSFEIPINDGPWKFMGLPGLILRINDTENLFKFELIGIENVTEPFVVQIPKPKFECKRKEFIKLAQKGKGAVQFNRNGGNITINQAPASVDYNPIELDIK